MDFKGITWAGNIYQKFENMCLEVEEVMYEDTVKYVENQAQKVGASVKKFCSEVMADLNSPSFIDPVKVAAGELSLNPYAHTDINKKPKSSVLLDTHGEERIKKETENKVISDLTTEKSSLNDITDLNRLCANNKNLGIQKRRIGIKRLSQNNRPPKVSSHAMKVTPSSGFVVRLDAGEQAQENKAVFGARVKSPASDKILSAEFVGQKKDHSECTSFFHGSKDNNIGTFVKEMSVSQPDSRVKTNNAREVESFGKDVVASKEGKFMKEGSSSQLSSNVRSNKCGIESEGDDVIVSYEDSFDVEAIENAEVIEPRVQIFDPVEKSKLEETCVLVEGDNLQFVSHGTHKHKSYKKKIREAISSKLRSTRKKDECISNYKDIDGKSNAGVAIGGPQDSSESDWELL